MPELPGYTIKTYRYLRLAMLNMLVMPATGVLVERAHNDAGCLQPSISDYYYTPARAVFVASLTTIGVCMIALKGSTEWEDILLNLGGMLAPVVAFVATPERHLLLGARHRAGHLCERREQHPRPVRRGRVGVVTVLVLARLDRARGQPLELPAHHRDGCLDRGPARRFRLVPVGAGQLHRQRPLRGRLRVVRRDRRSRRDQRP